MDLKAAEGLKHKGHRGAILKDSLRGCFGVLFLIFVSNSVNHYFKD